MTGAILHRSLLIALLAAAVGMAGCGGGDDEREKAASKPAPPPTTSIRTEPTATTPAKPDRPERKPAPPVAPVAPVRGLVIGIGEQQAPMFDNPRFRSLAIKHARLVAPYDAVKVRFERDLTDVWMAGAQRAGVEPFITFGHSRVKADKLPSVAEFRSAFRAFRKRYPDVKIYAPWNEINHISQPTHDNPQRAAEYYNVVREECSGCTVLAGDVLDQAGMGAYVKRYLRGLKGTPRIWGLHNYADANRFRDSGLRELQGAVQGDIWLTETGGIVKFGRSFPRDEQRAARAVRFALDLAGKHKRVKRVYLYNWTGAKPMDRFDSGLVSSRGTPRPGYEALRKALG